MPFQSRQVPLPRMTAIPSPRSTAPSRSTASRAGSSPLPLAAIAASFARSRLLFTGGLQPEADHRPQGDRAGVDPLELVEGLEFVVAVDVEVNARQRVDAEADAGDVERLREMV